MIDQDSQTPEEQKKQELLDLMSTTPETAKPIAAMGHELIEFSQFMTDVSEPLTVIVERVPSSELTVSQWQAKVDSMRSWHDAVAKVQTSWQLLAMYSSTTNTAINTVASGVFFAPTFTEETLTKMKTPAVDLARTRLFQTFERFPSFEKAKTFLIVAGMTVCGSGTRAPSEILEEAHCAMKSPVLPDGGVTSVLLPLRECIDGIITELIRRHQPEEKLKGGWKGKVIHLGPRCKKDEFDDSHFERLGTQAVVLMDKLSASKQADHSREKVSELFFESLLFINSLLGSFDESKMNRVK